MINFHFPLQPHKKYYIAQYEELDFSYSLPKWKMIILPSLTTFTSTFLSRLETWSELDEWKMPLGQTAEVCLPDGKIYSPRTIGHDFCRALRSNQVPPVPQRRPSSSCEYTAVALASEGMRTPYASGREICVQNFGSAYRQNRETNGAFQKHLYYHHTIQRILKFCSQTVRSFLSKHSRAFRDRLPRVVWDVFRLHPALRPLYASLPRLSVQLVCDAYHT